MAICGAHARSTGQPCQNAAMTNGRCRLHGGKSLSGVAAPAFKHGRYSKSLPTAIGERYQQALTDPELLSLRDEIALIDARTQEVLHATIDDPCWDDVVMAWRAFQATGSEDSRDRLAAVIEQPRSPIANWESLLVLLDQRRRLVESERKRLVETRQMITSEQAMVLLAAVVSILRAHIHDRNILAAISADIQKLTVVE